MQNLDFGFLGLAPDDHLIGPFRQKVRNLLIHLVLAKDSGLENPKMGLESPKTVVKWAGCPRLAIISKHKEDLIFLNSCVTSGC